MRKLAAIFWLAIFAYAGVKSSGAEEMFPATDIRNPITDVRDFRR